jgi:transposase
MRPEGTAQELERRRQRAIALLNGGHGICEVARMVGVHAGSVARWRDAYKQGGMKALRSKPPPGRPPKLSQAQRQQLIRLLKKGPAAHGYRTNLWTLARVAEVIRKNFSVRYHPSQVWRILKSMRWSCQKPERRARQRDEKAIAKWCSKDWPRIKKSPKNRS